MALRCSLSSGVLMSLDLAAPLGPDAIARQPGRLPRKQRLGRNLQRRFQEIDRRVAAKHLVQPLTEPDPGRRRGKAGAAQVVGSIAIAGPDGVLVRSVPVADAEQSLDWRGGLLTFHDTALSDAVAEFNRYNARKLVVADARAGALRVAGTFQWANAEGFVRLLERGFPVKAEQRADAVVLHSR